MKIRVENTYSDGHESVAEYDLAEYEYHPASEQEIEDYVWEFTGDGHGARFPGLGYHYQVTILEAETPELVGKVYEWAGC